MDGKIEKNTKDKREIRDSVNSISYFFYLKSVEKPIQDLFSRPEKGGYLLTVKTTLCLISLETSGFRYQK